VIVAAIIRAWFQGWSFHALLLQRWLPILTDIFLHSVVVLWRPVVVVLVFLEASSLIILFCCDPIVVRYSTDILQLSIHSITISMVRYWYSTMRYAIVGDLFSDLVVWLCWAWREFDLRWLLVFVWFIAIVFLDVGIYWCCSIRDVTECYCGIYCWWKWLWEWRYDWEAMILAVAILLWWSGPGWEGGMHLLMITFPSVTNCYDYPTLLLVMMPVVNSHSCDWPFLFTVIVWCNSTTLMSDQYSWLPVVLITVGIPVALICLRWPGLVTLWCLIWWLVEADSVLLFELVECCSLFLYYCMGRWWCDVISCLRYDVIYLWYHFTETEWCIVGIIYSAITFWLLLHSMMTLFPILPILLFLLLCDCYCDNLPITWLDGLSGDDLRFLHFLLFFGCWPWLPAGRC